MSDWALAFLLILFVPIWLPLIVNVLRFVGWTAIGALLPILIATGALVGLIGLVSLDGLLGFPVGTMLRVVLLGGLALVFRAGLAWSVRQMVRGWGG